MKYLIALVISLSFLCSSYSQNNEHGQPFVIAKIGLSFYPPDGFKLIDSSAMGMTPSEGVNLWRQGFIFNKDAASLIISLSTSNQKGIDWPNIHKKEAAHFFDQVVAKNPGTNFDSSSATIVIDSKLFTKFTITGRKDGAIIYNHVQLSAFIKGYKVSIVYQYVTPETGVQIDKVLATAKFID